MKKLSLFICINCFIPITYAQMDSLPKDSIAEIVISATRSEKPIAAVHVPMILIKKEQLQAIGSLRLSDVLKEQTGLAVVAGEHGQGLQIQGFNPDYTLILIDGEPLVGRTAGTLELSRIAVGNIQRVEIIKGASSSLYGSEALAGVVNIITDQSQNQAATLSARYGSNNTLDMSASGSFRHKNLSMYAFVNRYSTSGYDFSPSTFGQTVEPFQNYTMQYKINYTHQQKWKFGLSLRYFTEQQQAKFDIGTSQNPAYIEGWGKVQDVNINPSVQYLLSSKVMLQARCYATYYATQSQLNYLMSNERYDSTYFKQLFWRPELQLNYHISDNHKLIAGLGTNWETVQATRYEGTKKFFNNYAYVQYEWQATKRWNLIAGARFDYHSVYGAKLSPKFSTQYTISKKLSVRGSVGMGFKAPDFRQLYLNFTNAVAGYSVFGSEELPTALAQLQAQHQIAALLFNPDEIGNLKAESAVSYNLGFKFQPIQQLTWTASVFRNDVKDLIETQAVAVKTNGQNVFSYRNLNKVFTEGIETDIQYNFHKNFNFSVGYQYLIARDKKIVHQIKNGELYQRDPQTLITSKVTLSEYGGLFNRSRNMLNIKLFYENKKHDFSANIRAIYRGKYGLGDKNGNLILDDVSEYVRGYVTCNITFSKDFFNKQFTVQVGVDNLLNYKDIQNIPSLAGRLIWLSVQTKLFKTN